jgi:putative ABC transport system ATP-binding protein
MNIIAERTSDRGAAEAPAADRQAASSNPIIRLSGVRQDFGGHAVLDLPEWEVWSGRHCLVLGPSGCGKTTLLNLVAGLLQPTTGGIFVAGRDMAAMKQDDRDVFRGRHIGIVFQVLHLVGALSVADNLHLARYLLGLPRDEARVGQVLDSLGLADKAGARPRTLSQGEAQRVAIARAVINRPTVILADEPTSALDDANAGRVLDLLVDQAALHAATLVVATHDRRNRNRFAARLELKGAP